MATPILGLSEWDDATLTASEERVSFPASYLQREGVQLRWESIDESGIKTLRYELPDEVDPRVVSLIVLGHHNGTDRATSRIRFADFGSEIDMDPSTDTARWGPAWWASHGKGFPGIGTATKAGWTQTSFSIECWFVPEYKKGQGILQRAGGVDQPALCVSPSGHFQFKDRPNQLHTLSGANVVEPGKAYFLSINYDAGTQLASLIIVDEGTAEVVTEASVTGWDPGTQLVVSPTVVAGMSGKINEIRYWSAARNSAAVLADYLTPLTGSESNLLGVWGGEAPTNGQWTNRRAGEPPIVFSVARFAFDDPNQRNELWGSPDWHHRTWRHGFWNNPVGVTCRAVQIDLIDDTNPDGRLMLARAGLCEALQWPRYANVEGTEFSPIRDPSQVEQNLLGHWSGYPLETTDDWNVTLFTEDKWAIEWLREIVERAGITRDVFVVNDAEATTRGDLGLGVRRFPPGFQFRPRWVGRTSREKTLIRVSLNMVSA